MYSIIDKSRTYPTNGEQIYLTGRNQAGSLIAYQGGNKHAQMHATSCGGTNSSYRCWNGYRGLSSDSTLNLC